MSIIISDVSYHYFNQHTLFESASFSVSKGGKVSLIGNNGVGKSTLLKLLAGELMASSGNIRTESSPYYVPQQISIKEQTIAEALGVSEKLNALNAIYGGASEQVYYDTLNDDWDVETRCYQALEYWGLQNITLDSSISLLSGGEKTKVLLAGLTLHKPDIVLLDEPTNHLDLSARKKLYEYISNTKATIIVVSHDVSLLNLLDTTYELSPKGIRLYGGNYDFYREQKEIEDRALEQQIDAEQTALRVARKKAQEVRERQDRRASQGERSKQKGGVARIIMNARGNLAENSSAKLKEKHTGIIVDTPQRLYALRERQQNSAELKVDFEDAKLHDGKVLITAKELNFGYDKDKPLWQSPIDIEIRSGERIHITGNNGSGKTTFIKLLLGEFSPTQGEVTKNNFSYVYLDQEYEQVNQALTILELAERYNENNLADYEIKLRLNRALFPQETWDKSCQTLSGGERMRLYLCCLMISNHIPDIFVLDEPTNNLDLSSLSILTNTIKNYKGTILIISHDEYFINEIGVTNSIQL
jgi:ATPase subunit of ABC transporter with duplicated ATPase domains